VTKIQAGERKTFARKQKSSEKLQSLVHCNALCQLKFLKLPREMGTELPAAPAERKGVGINTPSVRGEVIL